jgi:hypothetical protein
VAAEWFGISKMPQRISDRLFNYSVHLSRWNSRHNARLGASPKQRIFAVAWVLLSGSELRTTLLTTSFGE